MKSKFIFKKIVSGSILSLILIACNITDLFSQATAPTPATAADANAVPFTLSPEDIEALKASSADSPMGPITDKDIEEFVSFINNLSEDDMKALESLAQEAAKEIEEAAKAESAAGQPQTPEIKPQEAPIKKEEKPKIPTNKVDEAKQILSTTAKYINDLKQEASKEESVSRRLNPWAKDLNDLVYYLNAINSKNVLVGHLLNPEFENFYQNLKKLNRTLEENIKAFSVEDIIGGQEYEEEDPYEILGVEQTATAQDIEDAFNKIKLSKDPKKIEEKLKAEKVDAKEIKRKLKEAKLSFNLIESAYEKLKNPKSRAQIDKEIESKQSSGLSKKEISKRAFSKILDSFGTAFYDNKILQDCVALLKKYDPIALETKKELDKAEEAAKKAKQEAAKSKVGKSPGRFSDYGAGISYGGGGTDYGAGRNYPSGGGYDSDYGNRYGSDYGNWGDQGKLKEKQVGSISKGGKPGEKEEKEKKLTDKNKKEEMSKIPGEQPEKAEKKIDPIKLMQEIDANLNLVNTQLENNPQIVKMLSITHEVHPAPGSEPEKVFRRSMPLGTLREANIVKWANEPKKLSEHQGDIDYLDKWQKNMQFDKLIEKTNSLEELIKKAVEKDPKAKKNLAKEFNNSLSNKLSGPVSDILFTVKNVSGDIKPVKNLLKNIESIYDNLHDIRSLLSGEKEVLQDIKDVAKLLVQIVDISKSAQVLDAQIKGSQEEGQGEEESEEAGQEEIAEEKPEKTIKKSVDPQLQKNLDSILKNLEGDRVFLSIILKSIDRIANQIKDASADEKQAYKAEWENENNPNSIASEIGDVKKLFEILQNNATQDGAIRRNTSILETVTKKLKEIEKNINL